MRVPHRPQELSEIVHEFPWQLVPSPPPSPPGLSSLDLDPDLFDARSFLGLPPLDVLNLNNSESPLVCGADERALPLSPVSCDAMDSLDPSFEDPVGSFFSTDGDGVLGASSLPTSLPISLPTFLPPMSAHAAAATTTPMPLPPPQPTMRVVSAAEQAVCDALEARLSATRFSSGFLEHLTRMLRERESSLATIARTTSIEIAREHDDTDDSKSGPGSGRLLHGFPGVVLLRGSGSQLFPGYRPNPNKLKGAGLCVAKATMDAQSDGLPAVQYRVLKVFGVPDLEGNDLFLLISHRYCKPTGSPKATAKRRGRDRRAAEARQSRGSPPYSAPPPRRRRRRSKTATPVNVTGFTSLATAATVVAMDDDVDDGSAPTATAPARLHHPSSCEPSSSVAQADTPMSA